MCQERKRTRDLLLEYDLMPLHPRAGGLAMVYPWENNDKLVLQKQIFDMAKEHGFEGKEEDLWKMFSNGQVIKGIFSEFPIPGETKNLYLDVDTGIVYYFITMDEDSVPENYEQTGAIKVGTITLEDGMTQYCFYAPIRTLLIENSILNGGGA